MGNRTPKDIWETALGELQVQVSKPNYRTWFEKTQGLSYQGNQFVIGVPNTFVGEYLEKTQLSLIEKSLIGLTSPDVQVVFQVNGSYQLPRAGSPAAIPDSAPRLNPQYSFESFIEGNGNRLALSAALAVAQNPGHSYNPLFIHGGSGLGKTHLLHAIGHLAAANHLSVICTSAEQFTNEFVTAVRERRTEDFRNRYRNAGMLLVDDIQFIGGKEQTEESFFYTFNELHNASRQVVLTGDRPPHDMPELEERLRSRFEGGLTVDLQPPDHAARLAILQAKAKEKETEIYPDVLDLIAGQIQHSIRELEGSLNRVIAYARLLRAKPTLEVASQALQSIATTEPGDAPRTPQLLLATVAESFQLTPEDLIGKARDKETVTARRVAMYILRQGTNFTLTQIGEELGGRDAAGVATACKKVATDITTSPYLRDKITEIRQKLNPTA